MRSTVVRFYIGASIGVCSASLVINRRLYLIATGSTVCVRYEDKVRRVIIDLSIGLGIPVLAMVVCESTLLSIMMSSLYPFLLYLQSGSTRVTVSTSSRVSAASKPTLTLIWPSVSTSSGPSSSAASQLCTVS